jgi:hypothetical protein
MRRCLMAAVKPHAHFTFHPLWLRDNDPPRYAVATYVFCRMAPVWHSPFDEAGVLAIRLADGADEAVRPRRHKDEGHVVRHQAREASSPSRITVTPYVFTEF